MRDGREVTCLLAALIAAFVYGCHGTYPDSRIQAQGHSATKPSQPQSAEFRAACDKLRDPNVEARTEGAIELRNLGDPAAVRPLTDALKVASSPFIGSGGNEQWLPLRILRKELVTSIEKLTGMKFDFPGPPDRNSGGPPRSYDQVGRLQQVVDQAEQWLKSHE
jgi:hypothetical protein